MGSRVGLIQSRDMICYIVCVKIFTGQNFHESAHIHKNPHPRGIYKIHIPQKFVHTYSSDDRMMAKQMIDCVPER